MGEKTAEEVEAIKKSGLFFIGLDKLVRGIKLYEGQGALVQQLLKDGYTKAQELFSQEYTFKITPVGPMFLSEPLSEEGKNPDYLFQMYCDGVRELSFLPSLTQDEFFRLAMTFYGEGRSEEDDYVTALWKQEFKSIRYYAVDTLGIQVEDSQDADMLAARSEQLASQNDGEEMTLSSADLRLLRSEDSLTWVQKCTSPSQATGHIRSLADQLTHNDPTSLKRFVAISLEVAQKQESSTTLLFSLWEAFVKKEDTVQVTSMLSTLQELGKELPIAQECLKEFFSIDLSMLPPLLEKDEKLLRCVEGLLGTPGFDRDRLVFLLKEMSISQARDSLLAALSKSGADMTEFFLENLKSEKEEIVIDAIRALGTIGSQAALLALGGALGHQVGQIRQEAIDAIGERYIPELQRPLSRLLKDPDIALRDRALVLLEQCSERSFGSALLGVIKEPDCIKKPIEEQEKLFHALSRFPNASTMSFFRDVLSDKNITRSSIVQQRQLIVVDVLKEINTDDSFALLEQQSKSWFLAGTVKESIKNALQTRK